DTRQANRLERVYDLLRFFRTEARRKRLAEVPLADDPNDYVRGIAVVRHGNIKVMHTRPDIGYGCPNFGSTAAQRPVIQKHADGFIEFTDALDPLAELQLSPKRDRKKAFCNFAVGEVQPL